MLTSVNILAAKLNDIGSFIFDGTYVSNWTMFVKKQLNVQQFGHTQICRMNENARCVCVCIAVYRL